MDVGTVLDGPAAVREGLIDTLGSLSDALACLYDMIDEKRKKEKKGKKAATRKKQAQNN